MSDEFQIEAKEVFISYLRADVDAVEEIATQLVDRGCTVWFDRWDMIPGFEWQVVMEKAVNACSSCAVFIGRQEPDSWQEPEMQLALNLSKLDKTKKFTVIPVLLDTPNYDAMKEYLKKSFIGLSSMVDFKHDDPGYPLHLLYSGIKRMRPGRYQRAAATAANGQREASAGDPVKEALLRVAQYRREEVISEAAYNAQVASILGVQLDLLKVTVHG
jgi:hypothetical protein